MTDRLVFRPDHKGRFDEIVARFADGMVYVETMDDDACYVGFYWDDGRYCQWWIRAEKKKLSYHHEDGHRDSRSKPVRAETVEQGSVHESDGGEANRPENQAYFWLGIQAEGRE